MILVTGGMGFIGLHTARSFLDLGHEVVITRFRTTRLPCFLADEVGKGLTVVPLDLGDPWAVRSVLRQHRIDGVVHLAVPPRTNLTPAVELAGATRATLGLLTAAIECGVTRVTAASSLAVYFGAQSGPYTESMPLPLAAGHPIEANKKIDEVIGAFLTASQALRVVRARIGSIWGPCYHSMMNAPSRLAMRALGRHERILGRPDPLAAHPDDLMDIFYARDCGRALASLQTRPDLPNDVYNVSAGHMTRYGDLVDAVNRAAPGADLALDVPDRDPIGDPDGYVDTTRLSEDIGFRSEFGLDRAMDDYVAWLSENSE